MYWVYLVCFIAGILWYKAFLAIWGKRTVGTSSTPHSRPKCARHCDNKIYGSPACCYKGADQGTLGPED